MPPPPPEHRLVCGAFPALEPAFVEAVGALKETDPLRRVDILVGSNLLAVYLRRRVAESLGSVANLRFLTFLDLAREIAPAGDPRPPIPKLGGALLARRALLKTTAAEAFGTIRGRPSLAAAVVSTADDLRDAGIAPADLPRLLEGASSLEDRKRHLRVLAAVLFAFEGARRRFRDGTSLLERAAGTPIAASTEPLLAYGLYDLGGLRESLLRSVAGARPVFAFVPDDGMSEPPGQALVRAGLFERLLGVDARRLANGPLPEPAVTIAPSENAEAREVVREILRAQEAGTPLHRIAILVRNPADQEPPLVAELALRGIPFYRPAGSGFAASPAGRAIRLLFALAAHDFPADAFRGLLDLLETLGRLRDFGSGEATPARLGAALASLGSFDGLEGLQSAVADSRQRLDRPFPAADDPDGWFAARRDRERKELDLLAGAVQGVRALLPDSSPATWSEWAGRLRRTADLLLPKDPDRERLERGLEAIEALERVEEEDTIDAAAVEALLEEAIDLSPEIRGRFERDGVSLLSAVSARGLLFDLVLVPGLVEQSFPRSARPDPLLFDEERGNLTGASGQTVVPRTGERHGREERFLFSLARASARKRLVLFAAAREIATDRSRLLSPFLLGLLPEEGRRALLSRELGEGASTLPGNVVWLPAGRLPKDGPPLDGDEALRRLLAETPALRKAIPPGATHLGRALLRGERRACPFFTEYEGKVGRGVRKLAIRDALLSASRLERLSQCAYRSFLERALGLVAHPEGDENGIFALEPVERGNALHAALRDLTRRLAASKRSFAGLGEGEIGTIASDAARSAVAAAVAARRAAPPPVLVEVEERRLRRLLLGVLGHLASSTSPLPLAGAEVRFGPPTLDPSARDDDPRFATDTPVTLPGLGFPVRIVGRIDRLDLGDGRALVVDYKTGKPTPYGATNRNGKLVAGGERLQLPVYALAARLFGAASVESEYLFVEEAAEGEAKVTAHRFDEARTAVAVEALGKVLVLLDEAVRSGLLFPRTESLRSKEPCRFCDFDAVCGPGHRRIYERKRAGEARSGRPNPLARLEEIP